MVYALGLDGRKIKAQPLGKATCINCGSQVIAKCGEINIHHWAHENLNDCDGWHHEPISQWHIDWQECFPDENREKVFKKFNEIHRADIVANDGMVIEVQNSPISPEEIYNREIFYGKMCWIINAQSFKHNLSFKNYPLEFEKEFSHYIECDKQSPNYYTIQAPLINDIEIIKALKQNNFHPCDEDDFDEKYWRNRSPIIEIPEEILKAFRVYLFDDHLQSLLDDNKIYRTNFRWKFCSRSWLGAKKTRILDLNNRFLYYIESMYESGFGSGYIISKKDFLKRFKS